MQHTHTHTNKTRTHYDGGPLLLGSTHTHTHVDRMDSWPRAYLEPVCRCTCLMFCDDDMYYAARTTNRRRRRRAGVCRKRAVVVVGRPAFRGRAAVYVCYAYVVDVRCGTRRRRIHVVYCVCLRIYTINIFQPAEMSNGKRSALDKPTSARMHFSIVCMCVRALDDGRLAGVSRFPVRLRSYQTFAATNEFFEVQTMEYMR